MTSFVPYNMAALITLLMGVLIHLAHVSEAAPISTLRNVTVERGISWPIVPGHALLIRQADHQRPMRTYNATETGRRRLEAVNAITNAAFLTGKHLRFYLEVGVGNRVTFLSSLMLDINAGLTWLQCRPCNPCYDQINPIFHLTGEDSDSLQRMASTSLACQHVPGRLDVPPESDCLYRYVQNPHDGSYTKGTLVADDFVLTGHDPDSVYIGHNVMFGCSTVNRVPFTGPAGVLALGLNYPHALQNQLPARLNLPDNTFSYCLSYDKYHAQGLLTFGGPIPEGTIFTPLVTNPNPIMQHIYYVTLLGISFGRDLLPIPQYIFDINRDTGTGGVMFNTVQALTMLPGVAYDIFRDNVLDAIVYSSRPEDEQMLEEADTTGFDLCFQPKRGTHNGMRYFYQIARLFENLPPIVFHFAGGASLEIPWMNILVPVNRDLARQYVGHTTQRERRVCMLVTRSPASWLPTILGNHLQIGTRVTIDTQNQRVGFTPRHCDIPPQYYRRH
ncbi:hypothetical protein L7F22_013314 [Adiantum nelumboides]|nr:hypothetical protein [Adiantum nelumboides]